MASRLVSVTMGQILSIDKAAVPKDTKMGTKFSLTLFNVTLFNLSKLKIYSRKKDNALFM